MKTRMTDVKRAQVGATVLFEPIHFLIHNDISTAVKVHCRGDISEGMHGVVKGNTENLVIVHFKDRKHLDLVNPFDLVISTPSRKMVEEGITF